MYTLHVISLEFTGNPSRFYRDIPTILLHGFPTSNLGYPHSIPVNQIPFKHYNGNQSVEISQLNELWVTCNSHIFEIPALLFPCIDPVNPCKRLQCRMDHGPSLM